MYEYLNGNLDFATLDKAVIDVSGVGFDINIPRSTYDALPVLGEQVKLLIHFHVREDIQKLYGFFTDSERDIFRHLLSINKVGPKVALNVLSGLSVDDIIQSVQNGDPTRLKSVSGIGPKTAQRLVLELKGKLNINATNIKKTSTISIQRPVVFTVKDDAYAALCALGYNDIQVSGALRRVEEIVDFDTPVEEWIKKALQVI